MSGAPAVRPSKAKAKQREKICTTLWTMVSLDTYILSNNQPSHPCQQGKGKDIKFHGKFLFAFRL
jgi:hypothetical protein